jgi:hypothetical protein
MCGQFRCLLEAAKLKARLPVLTAGGWLLKMV